VLPGPLSRHISEIWSLVLIARGIDHKIVSREGRFYITVSPSAIETAIEEIQLYKEENPSQAKISLATVDEGRPSNFVWIFLVATALMSAMLNAEIHPEVVKIGAARAGEIASGHIWLGLTALTLHSDPEHLLTNMLLGGFVLSHLARQTGTGLAFALVLLSGCMGNIMNAYIQPAGHVSIGSSTAVFGALSIIASINAVTRRTLNAKNFALPIFAALALLGFTGTHGEHTDILAHLCGFLSGL
jgi:membrane associated rhomboid family serine protease